MKQKNDNVMKEIKRTIINIYQLLLLKLCLTQYKRTEIKTRIRNQCNRYKPIMNIVL